MTSDEGFTVTGEVRFYDRPADSGAVASRGFRPVCGAALFSRNARMAGVVVLRASSLDDPDAITPGMVVYASRAPTWDLVDPAPPSFPEMPAGIPLKPA